MIRRTLLVVASTAALFVSAAPAGAWTLPRTYTVAGSTVHGTGRLCTASKFGVWHWSGTAVTPAGTYQFRWTEPITSNGVAHHLHYTYVAGSALTSLPASTRATLVAQIIAQLNRTTVTYVERTGPGDAFLEYNVPGYGRTHVRFRPHAGC